MLQSWVEEMAGYIKTLDSNHLVMLGHSGVFGASTPDMCASCWLLTHQRMEVGAPIYDAPKNASTVEGPAMPHPCWE